MTPACSFEELAHTAEIGVRLWAPTPAALFACAAHAIFALAGALPAVPDAEAIDQRTVELTAIDAESLLVDWLNELVYLYETSGLAWNDATLEEWAPTALRAVVCGRRVTGAPRLHVKAVTYHGLTLRAQPEGWTATVYFDI